MLQKIVNCEISITHISIELADKAGEVIVLEVGGEERLREGERVDDDEAVVITAPTDDGVCRRVVHHPVSLQHEGSRHRAPGAAAYTVAVVIARGVTAAVIFHKFNPTKMAKEGNVW